jgi:hypothetical protein
VKLVIKCILQTGIKIALRVNEDNGISGHTLKNRKKKALCQSQIHNLFCNATHISHSLVSQHQQPDILT